MKLLQIRKILALSLVILMTYNNIMYADSVMLSSVPTNSEKAVSQAVNTSFAANQYSGPGTLPTNANGFNTSMFGTADYSNALSVGLSIDGLGVSSEEPKSKYIDSPGAHEKMLSEKSDSAVITNYASMKGTSAENTADEGPKTKEIKAPSAGSPTYYNAEGVINNGNEYSYLNSGNIVNTGTSTNTTGTTVTSGTSLSDVPSYSTGAQVSNIQTTTSNMSSNTNSSANVNIDSNTIVYQTRNVSAVKPAVYAPAAIVVNASTRQIYFAKGGFENYYPSGLTNLVTSYLLLTYKNLNDTLVVSGTAITGLETGATTCGLRAGDTITVNDAVAALCVKSCCDVANVVAENVSGSVQSFVALMNQTVKNWGCVGTNFANPSGLNNNSQVTNVYDVAIIMDKVTQNSVLKGFLQLDTYTLPATSGRGAKVLTTSNQILKKGSKNYYKGIGASRMGYTSKAKYTIASEIDYNGQRLIAVALKANGTQFTDMTRMLNFAKVACVEASGIQNNVAQTTTNNMSMNISNTSNIIYSNVTASDNTPGSWIQDSDGWYFMKSNGNKASNEWIKQNGKLYCVDTNGYMVTGWREFSNGKLYYFDPKNGEFRYNTWVNVSTGAYYLQDDGSLATAPKGSTRNITTNVGTYTIDENGRAIAKVI